MSGRGALLDIGEVSRMLAAQVESLAPELLPNGRRCGQFWRTGSLADEPGESLAVNLSGARIGNWKDFAGAYAGQREGGDILHLVAAVRFGGDLKQAFAWARSWLGLDDLDPRRLATVRAEARARADRAEQDEATKREKKRAIAVRTWLEGAPIGDTPGEAYLRGRGIDLRALGKAPGALRYHDECWNAELEGGSPALVKRVQSLDGRHLATHRTWIEPNPAKLHGWSKARLDEPKMCLGRYWGGHIPLWKGACGTMPLSRVPEGTDLWISEGIEDGLSIAMLHPELRIVAGVSLGGIGAMDLPPQLGAITIIGQRDTKAQPIAALSQIVEQRAEQGFEVRLWLPPEQFKDANEMLCALPSDQRMAG